MAVSPGLAVDRQRSLCTRIARATVSLDNILLGRDLVGINSESPTHSVLLHSTAFGIPRWMRAPWPEEARRRPTTVAPHEVSICVPQHKFLWRPFKLPATDPRELDAMLALLASPEPWTQYSLQTEHLVTGTTADGYTTGLTLALQTTDISEAISEWELDHVERVRIVPSGLALYNAMTFSGANYVGDKVVTVAVSVSKSSLTVIGVAHGRLVFLRGVAFPAEGKITCADVDSELERSLSAFHQDTGVHEIDHRVLSYCELCQEEADCNAQDARCSSFERLVIETERLGKVQEEYHAAFGAALSGLEGHASVNLVPEETSARRYAAARRKDLSARLLLLLLFTLLATFLGRTKSGWLDGQLGTLRQEIAAAESVTAEIPAARARIELYRERLGRPGAVLNALAALCTSMPPDAVVTRAVFDAEDGSLSMHGKALKTAVPSHVVSSLSQNAGFSGVKLLRATNTYKSGYFVVDFDAEGTINTDRQGEE